MFDAKYFRTQLPAHAKAAGAEATVEVHILSGRRHRIRSVADVTDGYVVLEVHNRRAEVTGAKMHWEGATGREGAPNTLRVIVSYESITQVVITPSESGATTRIGFGASPT